MPYVPGGVDCAPLFKPQQSNLPAAVIAHVKLLPAFNTSEAVDAVDMFMSCVSAITGTALWPCELEPQQTKLGTRVNPSPLFVKPSGLT